MQMTPAAQAAARAFRAAQRAALKHANETDPPDLTVSVYVRQVRHLCAAHGGRSVNLELREHYVTSPQYLAWGPPSGAVRAALPEDWPEQADGPLAGDIPAGLFGFIFTRGRCGACGMTARSSSGRLVDPAQRPPAAKAVTGD